MRSFAQLSLGLLPLVLAGCGVLSFVSDKELNDKKDSLDIDGDGVPNKFDCDDYDDLRRPSGDPSNAEHAAWADPLWVDIPYDGIDNDCGELTTDTTADDGDLVDVDGDGYPGIPYDEYVAMVEAEFGITDPQWPANVSQTAADCVDQNGIIPLPDGMSADDINPSVLNEAPYDGVDQDCGGNNDFDQDGDGQMPEFVNGQDVRPLVEAYSAAWGIEIDTSSPSAFGDCDDRDASVLRDDSLPDAFYDGIDSNCDGNNDFDQDGDGYYPAELQVEFEEFVAQFHPNATPAGPAEWAPAGAATALPGDCLDAEHPNIDDPTLPALVHEGALDEPYDGIDADCLGDNDFDNDLDGYIEDSWIADGSFDAFVTNWSGTSAGVPDTIMGTMERLGGDCDDNDPNAAPGNLEILFDDADADCDGDPNTTPFGFTDLAWDSPSWPRTARTSAHYIVGTTAAWTSLSNRVNPAIALLFDADDAGYDAPSTDEVIWNNISPVNTFEHGSGFDLISNWDPTATPSVDDRFWVAATYLAPDLQGNPDNDRTRVLIREHKYVQATGTYTYELANRVFAWHGFDVDLDLQLDDGDPADPNTPRKLWILACGGGDRPTPNSPPASPVTDVRPNSFRTFTIEEPVTTNVALQEVDLLVQTPTGQHGPTATPNDSTACFQEIGPDGKTALFTVCDENGCESFSADTNPEPSTLTFEPTPSPNWNGESVGEADVHGDLLVLAGANGVSVYDRGNGSQYDWFAGQNVVSADAMWRDDTLFVSALLAGTPNQLQVAYSTTPATGPEDTIDLPVYDADSKFTHEPQGGCELEDPMPARCVDGRNLDPYKLSMHVDEDRLLIAVSAASTDVAVEPLDNFDDPAPQDAIGWVFLGFPPPPPI